MWKYRHSVKENLKSGYDWSASGQWQTAFCVCQWEHWECGRTYVQSGRQSKNAPIESWNLMWNWLTDCTQNNLSRSPAQLCQTMSLTAAVVRGIQFDFIWFRDEKCLPSNHHSTRKTIGFMHQLITGSDTLIPAVCYACWLWCPLPRHKWYDWTDICQPWGEGERPVLLRCLAVSADASSNRVAKRCLFTKQYVDYSEIGHFLCSVISQGKVVALFVKVIIENVVTCFFWDTVYFAFLCVLCSLCCFGFPL